MKVSKTEPIVTRSSRLTRPSRAIDESPPRARNTRVSPARSPSRKLSSPKLSGRRSPSRRSPARKSPARKSPSRKSPKITKSNEDVPKSTIKTSSKISKSKDTADNSVENSKPSKNDYAPVSESTGTTNGVDLTNKIRASLRERKPYIPLYESEVMSRRAPRLQKVEDNSDNVSTKSTSSKYDNLDDGNISEEEAAVPVPFLHTRQLFTPNIEMKTKSLEYGGKIMTFILVLTSPLVTVLANICCSKQSCLFTTQPSLKAYTKLENLINFRSILIVFSFFLINALTLLIPFCGKRTILPDGKSTFVANSVFSSVLIILVAGLVNYFCIPIFQIVYNDYVQLTIAAVIFGTCLSIAVYIRGGKVPKEQQNPHATTGNFFYDIWMGRELNPVFFKAFHLKVILFRLSLCGVILVNLIWILRSLKIKQTPVITLESLINTETYYNLSQNISINPTLILFSAMQIIYVFDSLVYESSQPTTFEFMYEGVGHVMCVGYNLYPFIPTLLTKRILEHNINLPNWVLASTLILFLVGYYIYRTSNTQKSIFRENRLDPRVVHLETIPTFQGKHLLVSSWWGFVRHPNYLGDLLMHTAWAVGAYNAIPVYITVFTYVFLIYRVRRDGKRCSERYGVAWKRYCQRVPYYLLPRVF